MNPGGVTLNPELVTAAADYSRRCESIGLERRTIADLQDAMNHPGFKASHHEMLDRLAKEYRASLPLLERPARFTLELGVYKTKDAMLTTVKGKGHKFSDYALGLIGRDEFVLLGETEKYDFFETTVKEVTGKDSVKTPELYDAMHRLGFIDAPFESASAIREVYDDQPMDEWRAVLSTPIAGAGGHLGVLDVGRHSGGSWVDGGSADAGRTWDGNERLFVCRKHQQLAS